MPELDQQTFRDIVNLLIPHCADPASRRSLATTALFGCKVLNRLNYEGNPNDYVVHFVTTLLTFGDCAPKKPAIVAVLEQMQQQVGIAQQEQIATLITDAIRLQELIATLADRSVDEAGFLKPPRNPYKGLRAFRPEDETDFFGRDALIEELVDLLGSGTKVPRLLAVLGASGSGKSSVVMAGLLPRLKKGVVNDSENWLYLDPIVPGTHPLESLTIALARLLNRAQTDIRKDLLDRNRRGLHALTREMSDNPVVLYIDQFEEVFTLVNDEAEQRQFIDLLTTAIIEPNGVLIVILSMRADFYDRPAQYKELGDLIRDNHVLITPMSLADFYDVVQKPAQLSDVGLAFDEGLVTEMVFTLHEEAGALPLLQFTLDQLFERREERTLTWAAYNDIGGVKGALAQQADKTYNALLSDQHRQLARTLFLRLIEPGATEQDTTRRRATYNQLTLTDTEQTRILQETADAFVDARLLVTDQSGEERTIEVSHEALIQEWERLGDWLHTARDDVQLQRILANQIAEWKRRGQPEAMLYRGTVLEDALAWSKRETPNRDEMRFLNTSVDAEERRKKREEAIARRVQNFQRASVVLVIVALIAGVVSVLAFVQQRQATQREQAANAQVTLAQEQLGTATIAQGQSIVREQAAIDAQATATVAQGQAEQHLLEVGTEVAATLTPIPITLEAVEGQLNNLLEAQRLAAEANGILLDDVGSPEIAAWLSLYSLDTAYISQAELLLLDAMRRLYTKHIYKGHTEGVTSVAYLPDGEFMVTGSGDKTARLWNVNTGEQIRTFEGHQGKIRGVAISSDGQYLATAGEDYTVRLWDIETGRQIREFAGENIMWSVEFSPDASSILAASLDGTARVWDTATGEQALILTGHTGPTWNADFSDDDSLIATSSSDGTARLWDAKTGIQLMDFRGHVGSVSDVKILPGNQEIVTAGSDGTIRLWNIETGEEISRFKAHQANIHHISLNIEKKQILTSSDDGTARVWNMDTGEEILKLAGNTDFIVLDAVFSPDGDSILTGSDDHMARLWATDLGRNAIMEHTDRVLTVAYSPDGQYLLTATRSEVVTIWDAASRKRLTTIPSVLALAATFTPDSSTVILGAGNGKIEFYDVLSGEQVQVWETDDIAVLGLDISEDGRYLAVGGGNFTVSLWDLETGEKLTTFSGHEGNVWDVAISPDNRWVVSASDDKIVRVWSVESGEEVLRYTEHTDEVVSVAISPDGSQVASAGLDGTVRLWSITTGETQQVLEGHNVAILVVDYSPEGNSLLTGSESGDVWIWSLATGTVERRLQGHRGAVWDASFSPNGDFVLTGSDDDTARFWISSVNGLFVESCPYILREFSELDAESYNLLGRENPCENH